MKRETLDPPKPRSKRAKKKRARKPVSYFTDARKVETIPSGCTVFDCALGGGWALNRIVNIVGDRSTGKTLLAIEQAANFIAKFPTGKVHYAEAEAAFDNDYAAKLGMPMEHVLFPEVFTVEDLFEDMVKVIDHHNDTPDEPALYIVDSLDALSDRAEQLRAIDEGSYSMTKQKKMSELFRRLVKKLKKSNVTVCVISQERDKIGVAFGKKSTRSGGRALDFYASQIVWLAHIGRILKTRNKVKRPIGVNVKASVEKNKIGNPFRTAEFPIIFGYGIEDVVASGSFLFEVGRQDLIGMTAEGLKKEYRRFESMERREYNALRKKLTTAVRKAWKDIEVSFAPKRKKY